MSDTVMLSYKMPDNCTVMLSYMMPNNGTSSGFFHAGLDHLQGNVDVRYHLLDAPLYYWIETLASLMLVQYL
jgi:hypothetical protein